MELAGVGIGVSKNTIIEYVTDRLLERSGLKRGDIVAESVPVIPERLQLLMSGRIKAATLPDPLAASALASGARLVIDDSAYPEYSVSVFTFSVESLEKKGPSVRLFLKAWDRAIVEINEDPDKFRDLMLKTIRVPKNVRETFKIPPYPRGQVPQKGQWQDVIQWMVSKGLLPKGIPYEESVTREYLP